MTDIPHFALPFRFATPHAAVNEQDSAEEITDCVYVALVCPQSFRDELPDYGLPDPTFASPLIDVDTIRETVTRWEPRATLQLDADAITVDELTQNLTTYVQVRTGE
jgi:predicted component of type VI protein secretion system